MIEPNLGLLETIDKLDRFYDEPEPFIHREDCPMSPSYGNPHKLSTFCVCKELDKADREGAAEDKWDDERKYGGL